MHRLQISAQPSTAHLLKKVMEELDQLSRSLSSMFVSSVYQNQSSGTAAAHGDISWATTKLHANVSCFLMFEGEEDKSAENSSDLFVHHLRNVCF